MRQKVNIVGLRLSFFKNYNLTAQLRIILPVLFFVGNGTHSWIQLGLLPKKNRLLP